MPSRRHGALPRRRRRDQDPHVRPRSTPRQGRLRGGVLDAGSLHGRILRRQGGGQVDAREGTRAPEDPRRDSHPPRRLQPARRPFRPVLRRRRQRLHPHGALQQQDARRRRETTRRFIRTRSRVLRARDRRRRRAPPRQPRHPPRPQTRKPLPHPRGTRRGWRGTGFGPRPRGTRRRGPSEDWRFRTRVSPRSRRRAEDHHLRDAQLHRAGSVGRK